MKIRALVFAALTVLQGACAAESIPPEEVAALMQSLTDKQEPTLQRYLAFYGPNAEDETMLLLQECSERNIAHDGCVKISNAEAKSPEMYGSRYFAWIRRCYQTVGKKWNVTERRDIVEGGKALGAVYEISLDSVRLTVQFVNKNSRYDGLAAAVFQINGVDTKSLMLGSKGGRTCTSSNMSN